MEHVNHENGSDHPKRLIHRLKNCKALQSPGKRLPQVEEHHSRVVYNKHVNAHHRQKKQENRPSILLPWSENHSEHVLDVIHCENVFKSILKFIDKWFCCYLNLVLTLDSDKSTVS